MNRLFQCSLCLALVAVSATALAACGSGGDSTRSTSAPTSSPTSAPEPTATTGEKPQNGASTPGEGSASFHTKGGDNSIQNFGEEADAGEREAAAAVLSRYLQALEKGDWEESCAHLASAVVKPLEKFAAAAGEAKGTSCAAVLADLTSRVSASARANTLDGGVASLRVEGERAFALFRDSRGTAYFVPMVKEGDSWKVGGLSPSEFP